MGGKKENLDNWVSMLKSVHNISHWLVAADGTYLTGSAEDSFFHDLFSIGSCTDFIPDFFRKNRYPILMHDNFDILWLAGKQELENSGYVIHLLGPIYETGVSIKEMNRLCKSAASSPDLIEALPARLKNIPILNRAVLTEYAIILQYFLTGETISPLQIQNYMLAERRHITELSEKTLWHGTWEMETELMRCVEEGNLNYRTALSKVSRQGQVGQLSDGDLLRQAKNELIVFTTLCTRAAIHSGISPESGYSIGDYYIKAAETCETPAEIGKYLNEMFETCIRRVHEIKEARDVTPSTRMAIDYITNHIWEKIKLSELSKELGYAEYYLSNKFQKEMGTSINQYIREKKIELAKELLRTSNYSTAEISDSLAFSSPSYFCTVFRKITGLTPMKYLEQFGEVQEDV